MTRAYQQTARADAVARRRRAIIESVGQILVDGDFDAMTLEAVAARAGVSLKTVTRHFGTRELLIRATMEAARTHEEEQRPIPVGDPAGVVTVLAARYELMAERIYRFGDLELRYDWFGEWVQMARRSHRDWLRLAFAPWLDVPDTEVERRLDLLFWATEIRSWWTVRSRFGRSVEEAGEVMHRMLTALIAEWTVEQREGRTQ